MAIEARTGIRLRGSHTRASRQGSLTKAMTAGLAIARANKLLDRDHRAIARKIYRRKSATIPEVFKPRS